MKCDLHGCWLVIYDWLEHWHRDPVANVVIYSSISFFCGLVSIGCGIPMWSLGGL